ncbi:MAG: hypothetical protein ACRD4J_10765 [Nitrososphaeraceae archaeon]
MVVILSFAKLILKIDFGSISVERLSSGYTSSESGFPVAQELRS